MQGWDKTYCLRYLDDKFETIHFFGDKTFEVSLSLDIPLLSSDIIALKSQLWQYHPRLLSHAKVTACIFNGP